MGGIEIAVPRGRIGHTFAIDGRTGAPPASAGGAEELHRVGRVAQVHDVDAVRIAAAALRGGGVQEIVDQVQCVRLAVGRHELHRLRDLFAIGRVQLAQASVPGDRVDGVLAGRTRGSHHRGRRLSSRAQRPASAAAGGRRVRAIEMLLPDDSPLATSIAKMLSLMPVTIATSLFEPAHIERAHD